MNVNVTYFIVLSGMETKCGLRSEYKLNRACSWHGMIGIKSTKVTALCQETAEWQGA